ncbi:helix-turn-helix transcriptional regulator [Trabulsiella odontotermitis]|uniref:Transcriptional regulator n=1 Tax=Trabulsiella odontotermitis TaxID=379893 RepID=A0A0L0GRW7_9ENTR|nr:helix-turn-helix domain-containing protein [Trabulsiella odontotermitis]KNC91702.1 transcriptional regulator [Trabulsiella odontotermitis]
MPTFKNVDYFFEKLETQTGLDFILRAREGVPENGMYIKPHVHLEHEIMWFYKASGSYSIGREKFNIQNNTLIYVSPLTLHDMELAFTSDHERFILQYDHTVLSHLKYPLPAMEPHIGIVAYMEGKDADRLHFLFRWFAEVYEKGHAGDEIKPLMILLLNTVLQHAAISDHVSAETDRQSIFGMIINFIIEMERRTSFNISLNDAADEVGLSPSHFSRMFKKVMQVSFKEYLLRKKISMSVQLLRNTDLSITDIAYKCEFTDAAYYCYQFRRFIGVTPKKFRDGSLTSEELKTNEIPSLK